MGQRTKRSNEWSDESKASSLPSTPCSANTTSRKMAVSHTVPGLEPSERPAARAAAVEAEDALAATSGIETELESLPVPNGTATAAAPVEVKAPDTTPSEGAASAASERSGVAVADADELGVRVREPVVVQGTPMPVPMPEPVVGLAAACSLLRVREEGELRIAETPEADAEVEPAIEVALRVKMPRTAVCGGVPRAPDEGDAIDTLEDAGTRGPFIESAPAVV